MIKLFIALMILGFTAATYADETAAEKSQATVNDAKRGIKKSGHRVKEAFCAEGDAKCFAKKAKHRGEEAKDSVSDKASELKNKAD